MPVFLEITSDFRSIFSRVWEEGSGPMQNRSGQQFCRDLVLERQQMKLCFSGFPRICKN
jgi:hypothetical protein